MLTTTYSPTEIRKMRGMLLNLSNDLDREIAALFASDPAGDDLKLAIREKSEARKALAIVDAMQEGPRP